MKNLVFIIASLVIFGSFNYAIYEKEMIKSNGEILLLELAPVDPRSLMQGDYMRLRYAIERDLSNQAKEARGFVVLAVDGNKVAKFVRFHDDKPLSANERLIRFHNNYGNITIVPDSFMFQEGHAQLYVAARYGIFKFDQSGSYILVGLADNNMKSIEPPQ